VRPKTKTSIEGTRLRRAAVADAGAVAVLDAACFSDAWSASEIVAALGSGRAVCFIGEPSRRGASPGAESVVPDALDSVVAFALFLVVAGEAELLRIAVAPAWRRRGMGELLLAGSLAELRKAGFAVCHLEVRAGNAAAIRLYSRLGFVPAGRRRGYYSDGEDALLYRFPDPAGG
jgi:ribosomal-protein-alanine N-acetyltransferase